MRRSSVFLHAWYKGNVTFIISCQQIHQLKATMRLPFFAQRYYYFLMVEQT